VAGTKGSKLWRLVQKYDIRGNLSDFDSWTVYDENGEVADRVLRWGRLARGIAGVSKIGEHLEANPNEDDLTTKASLALSGWIPKNKYDLAIEYSEVDYEHAAPAAAVGTRTAWPLYVYEDFKDEDYVITDQRGYATVFTSLAQDGGFAGKIQLNKKVTSIVDSSGAVTVHLHGGQQLTADYVIVTFSLGVLQRGDVSFAPKLPLWKRTAIQQLNMGLYSRVCFSFPKQFWPRYEFFQYASDLQGYWNVWQNLNAKAIFGAGSPHILCAVLTETFSRMLELQSEEETISQALKVLRKIFPKKRVPKPLAVDIPKWGSDPLFRGAYSSDAPGTSAETRPLICWPVNRVFFAGEACSERYGGWIHGSIDVAQKTAQALVNCLNDATTCPDRSKPVAGCQDPSAANYNPSAVISDGSCVSVASISRRMDLCYEHETLLTKEDGWPGLCTGLTWQWGAGFPGSTEACRSKCELDPACGVWQVDLVGACFTGIGNQCISRWGASVAGLPAAVSAAGMVQHGTVSVNASLVGLEVSGLRQVEKPSEPEDLAVDNCRGICSSNGHCRYWQYGAAGCFVEDPQAGYAVPDELDLSKLSATTDYAKGVTAGERLQHLCSPPPLSPERKDELPSSLGERAGLATPGWGAAPTLALAAALLTGAALGALGVLRFGAAWKAGRAPPAEADAMAAALTAIE